MDDDLEQVDLGELEERFRSHSQKQGFDEGLEQGRKAGLDEGLRRGHDEGIKVGSEIGIYRGHIMVWIQMSQLSSENPTRNSRLTGKLSETLDLINEFPKTNQMVCEMKLNEIRSRLKQITSLNGVNICDMISQG